jgi:hypothetical protein
MSDVILFLDFDGVLHRYDEVTANYCCYLPRLEAILRAFPSVRIVVSSNWRKHHDLQELQSFFSGDIAQRVIGVTPDLGATMDKRDQRGLRHHEAKAWREQHHFTGAWCALDDMPDNWLPNDPLIFCDDGFTDEEEAALRAHLRRSA